MAERRVAEIVGERQRLGQVLVEPQRAGDRAGDLRHLEGMGQARAEMVALVIDEDLGLVLQPAEGGRVDDAVAVAPARASAAGSASASRVRGRAGSRHGERGVGVRIGRGSSAIARPWSIDKRRLVIAFLATNPGKRLSYTDMDEQSITLTARAARRIARPSDDRRRPPSPVPRQRRGRRLFGLSVPFRSRRRPRADDLLIERDGARVMVDPVSLGFMHGAEIDFVDDLIGAQFKINNPNVTAACGCGTSFSV